MSGRYRTIVADPPWAVEWNANIGEGRSGRPGLPYETMTVEEICALPVAEWVEKSAFYDLVESVSPGPHLEMFSRRARLGWQTWGNEALGGTELVA